MLIETLVSLIVLLLVLGLLYWCLMRVLVVLKIGEPVATIVQVLIVLAVVLWIVHHFRLL